jgi:protein gp37
MTVLKSNISWCTGTLNLTVGCTAVSAGCDHCYAKTLVEDRFKQPFETIRYHARRLADLPRFRPKKDKASGRIEPQMVFVNSLSDFFHEDIPDEWLTMTLGAFEAEPQVIFQILTKRPVRMRKVIVERYARRLGGIPRNFWLGVSTEDNRVAARLNVLRRLKDQAGDFTAFVSVEPIIGPTDELDFAGIDWVLTGGESGRGARPMRDDWLSAPNDAALAAGIPLHFKQYGQPINNPIVRRIMVEERVGVVAAYRAAIERKLELAPQEKGGATYRGRVIQEKPAAYHRLLDALNQPELSV